MYNWIVHDTWRLFQVSDTRETKIHLMPAILGAAHRYLNTSGLTNLNQLDQFGPICR